NYRSSPELLEFFNDFFTQLDGRFRRMQTREPVTNPETNVASFVTAADDDPFGHVADHILNGLASGQRAGDYCILARTNDELFAAAMALERAGLSTFMHASDGYFERRETLDLLSLLKFILNPHDNVNFVRLFR